MHTPRSLSLSRFAVSIVSLLALAACGDDAGSTGVGGAGGSSAEGGAAGTGASGAGGGAPSDAKGYGSIGVYSHAYTAAGTPVLVSGAYAAYTAATDDAGYADCTTKEEGDCALYDCVPTGLMPPPPQYLDAGALAIEGALRPIALQPQPGAQYTSESSSTAALFAGGETLTATIAGAGDIPAHEATLIAPSAVVVSSPDLDEPVTIDRNGPLALAWSGGGAGRVRVVVAVTFLEGSDVKRTANLTCSFPASAGSGSVPASLLGAMPATTPTDYGSISVDVTSEVRVVAGDYVTGFYATAMATAPMGGQAATQAFLF
jgi:hypothetical protein